MRRWWRGGGAAKQSEERMSGNSESRSEIHLGVERREARIDEDGGGENVKVMAREPGEEPLKTHWMATSS